MFGLPLGSSFGKALAKDIAEVAGVEPLLPPSDVPLPVRSIAFEGFEVGASLGIADGALVASLSDRLGERLGEEVGI